MKSSFEEVDNAAHHIGLDLDKIQGLRDSRDGDHPSKGFHILAFRSIGAVGIWEAMAATQDEADRVRELDGKHYLDAAAYFGRCCKNIARDRGVTF